MKKRLRTALLMSAAMTMAGGITAQADVIENYSDRETYDKTLEEESAVPETAEKAETVKDEETGMVTESYTWKDDNGAEHNKTIEQIEKDEEDTVKSEVVEEGKTETITYDQPVYDHTDEEGNVWNKTGETQSTSDVIKTTTNDNKFSEATITETVTTVVEKLDENGQNVLTDVYDKNGNLIENVQADENGNPVIGDVYYKDGSPVAGDKLVVDYVKDSDGNNVMSPIKDKDGNTVMVQTGTTYEDCDADAEGAIIKNSETKYVDCEAGDEGAVQVGLGTYHKEDCSADAEGAEIKETHRVGTVDCEAGEEGARQIETGSHMEDCDADAEGAVLKETTSSTTVVGGSAGIYEDNEALSNIKKLLGDFGITANDVHIDNDVESNFNAGIISVDSGAGTIGSNQGYMYNYDKTSGQDKKFGTVIVVEGFGQDIKTLHTKNNSSVVIDTAATDITTTNQKYIKTADGTEVYLENATGVTINGDSHKDVDKTIKAVETYAKELHQAASSVDKNNDKVGVKAELQSDGHPNGKYILDATGVSKDSGSNRDVVVANVNVNSDGKLNGFGGTGTMTVKMNDDQILVLNINAAENVNVIELKKFNIILGGADTSSDGGGDAFKKASQQIIFNFGSFGGNVVMSTSGGSVCGTFIAPKATVKVGNTSTGQVVCNKFVNGNFDGGNYPGEWHYSGTSASQGKLVTEGTTTYQREVKDYKYVKDIYESTYQRDVEDVKYKKAVTTTTYHREVPVYTEKLAPVLSVQAKELETKTETIAVKKLQWKSSDESSVTGGDKRTEYTYEKEIKPLDPEDPEEPQNPENPEDPKDPEDPKEPENPEDPETPENPQEPENPKDPVDPDIPVKPERVETSDDNIPVYPYVNSTPDHSYVDIPDEGTPLAFEPAADLAVLGAYEEIADAPIPLAVLPMTGDTGNRSRSMDKAVLLALVGATMTALGMRRREDEF